MPDAVGASAGRRDPASEALAARRQLASELQHGVRSVPAADAAGRRHDGCRLAELLYGWSELQPAGAGAFACG